MSEKHLYEKHLAEKLQQLSPPPEMEKHWREMKALLDDDRPRGGGFGKRWWRIGVIAGILLIGTWFAGTYLFTGSGERVLADKPNSANVEKKNGPPGSSAPTTDDQVADNGEDPTPIMNNGVPERRSPGKGDPEQPVAASDFSSGASTGRPESGNAPVKDEPATTAAKDKNVASVKEKQAEAGNSFSVNNQPPPPGAVAANKVAGYTIRKSSTGLVVTGNTNQHELERINTNDDVIIHSTTKPIGYSPLHENIDYTGSIDLAPGDHVKKDLAAVNFPKKETLKSRSSRAGKNREERSFAFGLSLPLAFPLGDQKALSYNFNAGANTVSDYIPSPHVQYRLNKKTYLQTELQFISPQYIRPILLYEQRAQAGGNYLVYTSIYARKLYYFNLPVGIHYSPFQNFYLGSGLQFSTLLSGVGLYEETKRTMSGQPVTLLNEHYAKLSGDSLSNRMNRGEVRLMLEANYYFNRFTFGLRYNQAFNNYVNFRIDNMSPYTFDKNKALQFYLRYNLWEDVRRKHGSRELLSSK